MVQRSKEPFKDQGESEEGTARGDTLTGFISKKKGGKNEVAGAHSRPVEERGEKEYGRAI